MFQLFVEGRGENAAGQKLVHKIVNHLQLGDGIYFSEGRRMPNLHTDDGLRKVIELARLDSATEGVLIIRDCDDDCPRELAPLKAAVLNELNAPFPIGYCLLYREFETLFVSYAQEWAGQTIPHLIKGTLTFNANIPEVGPENVRGAKEWISQQLSNGRVYKPTTDQLSLTQAMDISTLELKGLPCFETLVRCIRAIIQNRGNQFVYPTA